MMFSNTIRKKLLFGMLPSGLILLSLALFSYSVFYVLDNSAEKTKRNFILHMSTEDLQLSILSAIMSPNDYLITGNQIERENFASIVVEVEEEFFAFFRLSQGKYLLTEEGKSLLFDTLDEWEHVRTLGEEILALANPVGDVDGARLMHQMDILALELIEDLEYQHQQGNAELVAMQANATATRTLLRLIFLATIVLFLVGWVVLAWRFSTSISAPLIMLSRTADALGQGNLEARALVEGNDEVASLGHSLNTMADILRQRLFENVPIGLYQTTPEGQIIDVNSTSLQMLGYLDRESLLAINVKELYVNTLDLKRLQVLLIQGKIVLDHNAQLYKYDGSTIWVRINIHVIRDSGGRLLGYEGSLEDISVQKWTEQKLKESENQLKESQRIAKLGHYSFDVKTGCWTSSTQLDDIFGIDENYKRDINGWLQIVHPDFTKIIANYLQDHILGQQQQLDQEYKIINLKTEQEKWVHGLGSFVFDESKKSIRMFGTIQDITAYKQTEAQIHLQASALKSVTNSIFITDETGVIQWVNAAFTQLTGYSSKEAVGQNPHILKSGKQDPSFYRDLWAVISSGKVWQGELINRRKDGSTYIEEQTITPLLDKAGKITHFIAIKQDVTEKRESREQLQQSEHRYRRLVEFSPDIIYIHDGERVTFINQTGVRLIGAKNVNELIGRTVQSLFHPEDWPTITERIKKTLKGIQDTHFIEQQLIRLDGTPLAVEVRATSYTQGGQPAVLVLARDIRKRKQLQDELIRTTVETITLLAKTVDEKDEYTAGHCERLSKLAVNVGAAMGMNRKKLEQLRYAALLHDLGKIGIPDEILNKPSELNDKEWAKMKEHPCLGKNLIERIHALKPVSKVVLQHHEHWDGNGYPQGLKGESILLGARILSVVDAYDAMTTNRPYRKALSKEKVIDELCKGRGSQFAPDVVDAFVAMLQSKNDHAMISRYGKGTVDMECEDTL